MGSEKDAHPEKSSAYMSKAEEAAAYAQAADADHAGPSTARANEAPPPAYEPPAYGSTTSPISPSATSPIGVPAVPTVSEPFNFPPEQGLPSYDSLAADLKNQKPIAIPQLQAVPTAGFVPVYAPSLLTHGITKDTWSSFLNTVSAFLTAKVSDRAVSHAGDMAKDVIKTPKSIGQGIYSHSKDVGKDIARHAKKGNIFGAAFGAIGGAVSIPIFTAMGIVGAATSLPGVAIGAVVKKPQTPGQRAAAYAAVANKKWLHARGLHAQMLDSNELAQLLQIPVLDFLRLAQQTKDSSADGQLRTLEGYIAPLDVQQGGLTLELDTNTIWLVLVPGVPDETAVVRDDSDSDTDSSSSSSSSGEEGSRKHQKRQQKRERKESRRQRKRERREDKRERRARRGKQAAF